MVREQKLDDSIHTAFIKFNTHFLIGIVDASRDETVFVGSLLQERSEFAIIE
jgi:hypothetical protein